MAETDKDVEQNTLEEQQEDSATESDDENTGFFGNIAAFVGNIFNNDSDEKNEESEKTETENTENYGDQYHVEQKNSSEMTEEELAQAQEDLYNREIWYSYGTKTEQHGDITTQDADGNRFDLSGEEGETVFLTEFGGTVSYTNMKGSEIESTKSENEDTSEEENEDKSFLDKAKDVIDDASDYVTNTNGATALSNLIDSNSTHTIVHYEGELGTFDYDTKDWALGLKTVTDPNDDGISTQIPVLRYIGSETDGDKIDIPDGLLSLDYSFEGTKVKSIPDLSTDSVIESTHGTFQDCQKLEEFASSAYEEGTTSEGYATGIAGGLITGAATGFGIGATVGTAIPIPVVGNVVGGIIGTGVGVVGGITAGLWAKGQASGHAGEAYMPDTIKDASNMFTGDEKLKTTYAVYGASCQDITDIYHGCKQIGNAEASWWEQTAEGMHYESDPYGEDSLITPESAQGAYTGTNSVTPLTDQGISNKYNYETMELDDVQENSTQSVEEANEDILHRKIENLNAVGDEDEIEGIASREEAIAEGDEKGSADFAAYTKGLSTQAVTKDENGNDIDLDTVEDQIENAEAKENEENGWTLNSLIDRAGMSVLEYGVAKLITKSTIGSIAIVAAGQFIKFDINGNSTSLLPTSMTGILDGIAGFLRDDSSAGKALSDLSTYLKGTNEAGENHSETLESAKEKYAYEQELDRDFRDPEDNTDAAMSTRINYEVVQKGVNVITESGTDDEISNEALANLMHASGVSVAKDNVLLTAEKTPEENYVGITSLSEVQAQMMQEKIEGWADEDSKNRTDGKKILSDEHKAECLEEFTNILVEYDAYSQGLMDGIEEASQTRTSEEEKTSFVSRSMAGAEKVMQSTACPFLDMMKEMDETYDILPTDDYLDGYTDENGNTHSYNIAGVNSFSSYAVGSGIAYASDEMNEAMTEAWENENSQEQNTEENQNDDSETDGQNTDEDEEYENIGIEDDSDTEQTAEASETNSSHETKVEQAEEISSAIEDDEDEEEEDSVIDKLLSMVG